MVALQPLYVLFRLGGFHPIGLTTDLFFTVLSGCFQIFVWTFLLYSSRYDFRRAGTYVNIVVNVMFWMSGIAHLAIVHCSKHRFRTLISNFKQSAGNGFRPDAVLEMSITISITVLISLRMWFRSLTWFTFIQSLLSDLGTLIIYTPLVQQSLMVHQLTVRFSVLNDQLETLADAPANGVRAELASIFKTYSNTGIIVEQINSFFAVFNLWSLISRLFGVAFIAYYVLTSLTAPKVGFVWSPIPVWLSVLVSTIYHLEICYRCSSEVRILHK